MLLVLDDLSRNERLELIRIAIECSPALVVRRSRLEVYMDELQSWMLEGAVWCVDGFRPPFAHATH